MLRVVQQRLGRIVAWAQAHDALLQLAPWLVVGVNALIAKQELIVTERFAASEIDISDTVTFSVLPDIHQFRSDLLLCFFVMPAAVLLLLWALPSKWRGWASALLAIAVQTIFGIEIAAYTATDGFVGAQSLMLAAWWAVRAREVTMLTVPFHDGVYCCGGIALVMLVSLLALKATAEKRASIRRGVLVAWLGGALLCGVACSGTPATSEWKDSLLMQSAKALLARDDRSETMSSGMPELMREYASAAHVGVREPEPPPYWGKAKGYNVVFFILEATPAEVLDPSQDSLDDMPNLKRLRKQSFVARRHYTSYPLTNRALFSIYTSMYTRTAVGPEVGSIPVQLPGVIRTLRRGGYRSGYYGYVWRAPSERDDLMLTALGTEKLVEPRFGSDGDSGGLAMFGGQFSGVAKKDQSTLDAMCGDIRGWAANKQKFVVTFFPEIGHDPWRNITGREGASVRQMGRALAAYHDRWLGQLVEELQRDRVLDRTIIVVTADHGLRTVATRDQPQHLLVKGKLDDAMMRVPLLIFAPGLISPGATQKTITIEGATSHVDLAPTILDLLGVEEGRQFEQGMAIWDTGVAQRRVFMSASIFGADGFVENGTYYMANKREAIYKSRTLHFEGDDLLPYDGAEAREVRDAIKKQNSIQNALMRHLLNGLK